MAKEKVEMNIRSEEVEDIMSKMPNRIIRYGITVIFGLILLGILLMYVIRYPEIITGRVVITTQLEPLKVVSQSSGTLHQVLVKEGDLVNAGTLLAEIDNPVSSKASTYLRNYLRKLEWALHSSESSLPLPDTSAVALGDAQQHVNSLLKEILAYNLNTRFKMDDVELRSLAQKITNQKELIRINLKIIDLNAKELDNAKAKYEADKKLYKDSMMSKMDFYQNETNYRAKELQLEKLNQTQVDYMNVLNNLELQNSQSGFNKYSKTWNNLEAIQGYIKAIRSFMFGWQQKYNLTSTQSGTVSFLQRIQPGQFLKGGEELFAISQPQGTFIGIAKVPVLGLGKVAIGQTVHVLLDAYPYYEYGMLDGVIRSVSLFPSTNEYRVEIELPRGMHSTTGDDLKFSPEMAGEAEIITKDLNILERVFESLIKTLHGEEKKHSTGTKLEKVKIIQEG